jgi:glucose/arabinose dehydrogenase
MRRDRMMLALATVLSLVLAPWAGAQNQGVPSSGGWVPRAAVKPDASKIVVPKGYKVEVFADGLDSASAATVDGEDNVWVAISGNLFGPFEYEYGGQRIKNPIPGPHVKVFDKTGKHLKDIGLGTFKTVMNEIGYCPENKKVYIPEYRTHIWEIDGVNGELRKIITDLPGGDHEIGGITCKDGYLYWGQGLPSNTGFADPDNHGWTEEVDPFWEKHGDPGLPKTKRDPVCREIVHTGLNVRSADGRMTGALLPVGVPAKPGMVIKPTVPCGGSIMRVALNKQGSDGMYKHEEMEVYAFGFRNQSGVAFGPKGSRFENALAVTDNGANDLGHRRVANGAEKLFIVTEKGQDAGFPDKEGFNFVTNKRFSLKAYNGAAVERPHPQLYIGDKPWVPQLPPYRLPPHVEGVRGVPLIVANPNPNGYINPVMEWDTNNPMDGIAWGDDRFGAKDTLFAAVFGVIDNGPESVVPTWPAILRIEFLQPTGVKWSYFLRNVDMGPNAYQKPENRGGLERTNDVVFANDGKTLYVVDYGELYVDFSMPSPFFQTPKSSVIWKVTYTGN